MRILIVEDNFINRKLLTRLLEEFASIDTCNDGLEALEAVKLSFDENEPYDAIFLDIMMPNLNGQEALKKIRKIEEEQGLNIGEGAKIIMTTALDDSQNVIKAFRESCDGYLTKPITRDKIINQLEELGLIEIEE